MPSADEIRDGQRAAWDGLSAGWEKWDSVIMDQLGPVSVAMIERLDIAADQRRPGSGDRHPLRSVSRTGLEQQHPDIGLFGEARRQNRARPESQQPEPHHPNASEQIRDGPAGQNRGRHRQ